MKIRIIYCSAFNEIFENLIEDSVHEVIEVPKGEKKDDKGLWVMGVGEPVKLLNDEFEIID